MKTPFLSFLLLTGLLISAFTCTNPSEPDNKPTGSDTTSHNFIWQSFGLGKSNSIARDVHVFSDTNIWVVGGFSTKDHFDDNGNNLAIWNGVEWKYKQFRLWKDYRALGGELKQELTSITGILAFSENDIVLMDDWSSIARWDGTQWSYEQPVFQFQTYDHTFLIAGNSTHDFYMFGFNSEAPRHAIIIHYKNGVFTPVLTDIVVPIYDATTDEAGTVWFSTYDESGLIDYNSLYKLKNGSIQKISYYHPFGAKDSLTEGMFALDCKNKKLYGMGNFYWKWTVSDKFKPELYSKTYNPQGSWAMSVNSENDIIFGSSNFAISHWNGSTLKSYPETESDFPNYRVLNSDYQGNSIGIVGWVDDISPDPDFPYLEVFAHVVVGRR